MLLVLPRTQTSLPHWKCARKRRRHGDNGWDVFTSHFSHSHGSLAFHHQSLACLSRFALVSVKKRTKTPEEAQLLGRLLINAFISTFMTSVSWRHIGHSPNIEITKRRKLTRRFYIFYQNNLQYTIRTYHSCDFRSVLLLTRVKNYVTAESMHL